jgi:hypothetical protein
MALYRIENLKDGVVVLPQPIGIRLAPRKTIVYSGPAGMNEANGNRRYGQLFRMIDTGLIRVTTVEDPARDDNVEVATVSMLGGVTADGQYRAVADIPTRDAIPADQRVEGMVVRTNDTGIFWVLAADLTTWTQVDSATQLSLANILATLGTISTTTSLAGLLTNTGNYFPFSDLPDATPSVVETVNTLNEQIGNRDYTGPHLTDGQTITASLQALSSAVGSGGITPTQVGQTIWSVDGLTFTRQLPLTSVSLDRGGWLLNDQGYMLVVG